MATNRATRYPGRWGAVSADYPMGEPKNRTSDTAKDGSYFEKDWVADYEAFFGAILNDAGEAPNGTTDTATSSQLYNAHVAKIEEIATEKSSERVIEVSPRNNDWNGYLDPDHQSNLPAPNGYPGASGGGEASYTADQEISSGIFSGSGGATVSSDSDGWIFTGSIYKLFDYTAEQLNDIVVTEVPVYLKNQVGTESFLKHNGTSVIVTKVGSQLKVEITDAIFTVSFTKLWRFFVTEIVGRVGELSADAMIIKYLSSKGFDLSQNGYEVFPSGLIIQWGVINAGSVSAYNFPIPFPNNVFSLCGGSNESTTDLDETIGFIIDSNSSFRARSFNDLGTDGNGGTYIAIGN